MTISKLISAFGGASVLDDTDFQIVLINTEGNITVGALEKELSNSLLAYPGAYRNIQGKPFSRTIFHGAYTGMFRSGSSSTWGWEASNSPGTPQFFANMACWSANVR